LLATHKEELHLLAKALLEQETLDKDEIEQAVKGITIKKDKTTLTPREVL